MRKPRPTKARALSKGRRTRTKARDTAPKSRVGSKQPGSGKTPATGGAKGTKEAGKLKGRAGRPLLIVESPTKARTIGNLLGARFTVLSSKGHIVDLPKTRLGVDLEHDFEPSYIQIPGKREIVRTLRQEASRSQEVLIGTDPDREGEAIAYFIAQAIDGNTARRVRFHEITQEGVRQALARPVEIDLRMVDAQKARRVLDRLVGYLTSPLLWRVMENHNLSAGRVQSVALRLICEREREIQAFVPEEFWTIECELKTCGNQRFPARLVLFGGQDCRMSGAQVAQEVARDLEACPKFMVLRVVMSDRSRSPGPPFNTSSLQQDAAKLLRFSGRKTMSIAQQLFEGVKLGTETVGLITYPRTDSYRVADQVLAELREFIKSRYGPEYLSAHVRSFKERRGTQGAHEAIRPTSLSRGPEAVRKYLSGDQYRLYEIIYRRFVASQMADARYRSGRVEIAAECPDRPVRAGRCYLLQASALKLVFAGFERVYGDSESEKYLPELSQGEELFLASLEPKQHFTQPPPRYTEAALIKRLEVNGIGRPSTYATIAATLDDRDYIQRRAGKLIPTELGLKVNDLLVPRFGNIFEVRFTREMEDELDRVEEGRQEWREVVRRFYAPFREDLERVEEEFGLRCPECGKPLAVKWGRYGSFLACSAHPKCNYVKKEQKEVRTLDAQCPECGRALVERNGKYGAFIACSGYPECKYVQRKSAAFDAGDGDASSESSTTCPECGKPLVEKEGRYGKFWGCSGYPECNYLRRPEPVLEPDARCPNCNRPLVIKNGRFGKFVGCSGFPECKYIRPRQGSKPKVLEIKCPECGKSLVERKGRFGTFVSCSGYPECRYQPGKEKA